MAATALTLWRSVRALLPPGLGPLSPLEGGGALPAALGGGVVGAAPIAQVRSSWSLPQVYSPGLTPLPQQEPPSRLLSLSSSLHPSRVTALWQPYNTLRPLSSLARQTAAVGVGARGYSPPRDSQDGWLLAPRPGGPQSVLCRQCPVVVLSPQQRLTRSAGLFLWGTLPSTSHVTPEVEN